MLVLLTAAVTSQRVPDEKSWVMEMETAGIGPPSDSLLEMRAQDIRYGGR